MKHRVLTTSTALALILTAGSACAVTPEEVWTNWKSMTESSGAVITTESESRDGDVLTLTGLKAETVTPEGVVIATEIESVTLTDLGDGAVEVVTSDIYPVTILPEGKDSKASVVIEVAQPGATMVASGTAAETSFEANAPTTTATLTRVTNTDGTAQDAELVVTLADLTGKYLLTTDAAGKTGFDYTLTSGALTAEGRASNAANPDDKAELSISIASLNGSAKGVLLPQAAMENLSQALADGFAVDSSFATGAISFGFDLIEAGGPTQIEGKLEGADFNIGLDAAAMDYGIGLKAFDLMVNAAQAGVPPLDGSFGELAFGFSMPVAPSDDPQPFALLAKLVDVTLSDSVWGMVDPGAVLGRDPATLVVDVKGTGAWNIDIMDPALQTGELPTPEVPGELHSADLSEFLLKLAGAGVTGTGALTFDNSDLATWDGFPAPTGKLTFTLTQVNTLLDKLVAMGLIPEDQLMGIRMGLAMFAKPGPNPDELLSEVEFKDGGLFVNGQQLR